MDLKRFSFARQILPASGAAVALALLAAARQWPHESDAFVAPGEPLRDLYLHAAGHAEVEFVIPDSIAPHIVVGEESHDMRKSDQIPGIYEFDYRLPPDRTPSAITTLSTTDTGSGLITNRQAYTELPHASIVSRYVLSLEANRGPVGARIGVLGRGFTPQDLVGFDGTPVRTVYESPTSLGFFVPALAPGRTTTSRSRAPRATRRRRLPHRRERCDRRPRVPFARARAEADLDLHRGQPGAGRRPPPRRHHRHSRERDHARGDRSRRTDIHRGHGRGRQARHWQPLPEGIRHRRSLGSGHGAARH